jgi:hypothetical protein
MTTTKLKWEQSCHKTAPTYTPGQKRPKLTDARPSGETIEHDASSIITKIDTSLN